MLDVSNAKKPQENLQSYWSVYSGIFDLAVGYTSALT